MTVITAHIQVAEDGTISGHAPQGVPAGEHMATITVAPPRRPGKPFTMEDFPIHDEPWDGSVSLRREDMYDEDGRLR